MKDKLPVVLLCLCGIAIAGSRTPNFSIRENSIDIARPTGAVQTIKLNRRIGTDDVKFEDLNFDGGMDLKILIERGANQELYDVYLYSKSRGKYVYSRNLSEIPCVTADAANREIIGACFHESSCENWEEHYSITSSGMLSLTKRVGTYCDSNGDIYSYVDRFKNGKKISSKSNN
jgi:hypothetical protein